MKEILSKGIQGVNASSLIIDSKKNEKHTVGGYSLNRLMWEMAGLNKKVRIEILDEENEE